MFNLTSDFRHFIELVRGPTGLIYGRHTYEIMRCRDEDLPDWDAEDRDLIADDLIRLTYIPA